MPRFTPRRWKKARALDPDRLAYTPESKEHVTARVEQQIDDIIVSSINRTKRGQRSFMRKFLELPRQEQIQHIQTMYETAEKIKAVRWGVNVEIPAANVQQYIEKVVS